MKHLPTHLKALGLCWLRFAKSFPLVATEAGYWNADVLGIGPKSMIEIETKISKSDLKADYKKMKHTHYREGFSKASTPNKFYFLVPKSLEAAALIEAERVNPKYGVLIADDYDSPIGYPAFKTLKCVRKAKELHTELPHEKTRLKLMLRMSSEICMNHIRNGWDAQFVQVLKSLDKTPDVDPTEVTT